MSESNNNGGGIGFVGLLTIVFIVLKLTGVVAWSWWWVFSPVWIAMLLALVILGILLAIAVKKG